MIRERPIYEMSSSSSGEDFVLTGLFQLLKNICAKLPKARETFSAKNEMIQYLVHDCLFKKDAMSRLAQKDVSIHPKCKSGGARDECLFLIRELARNNESGVRLLVDYLRQTIYSNNMS